MTLTTVVQPEPRTASRLEGRLVPRPALAAGSRDAMFALLRAHFAGVDRATFDRDLDDKSLAILLEDETGVLRGFSTMVAYDSRVSGVPISVVYSGDTIVDRAWWGSPALAQTWVRAVRQLAPPGDRRAVYWLLLTSGFRTYRFLPVFFRDFCPRHDGPAPQWNAVLLDLLARERFGSQYDPRTGIVRLARPQVLAPDLVALPEGRMPDPHVAYFLARNPGYVRGDELACLTRIDEANLTAAGRRMARGPRRLA